MKGLFESSSPVSSGSEQIFSFDCWIDSSNPNMTEITYGLLQTYDQ